MRKIITFLMAIFLCAIQAAGVARAQEINASQTSDSLAETGILAAGNDSSVSLSAMQVNERIAAAKELLKSQAAPRSLSTVRLALFDVASSQTDFLSLSKDSFLLKNADCFGITTGGRSVRLRVVRANGVNTAVTVTDIATKRALLPLVVQFPIEKKGTLKEMAYYSSAHPALVSPAVIASGQDYVTTMLDRAAANLAEKGIVIDPEIVTIAQHLVIVEHTDHHRFLNEDRAVLFPEILSLYALNQDNTFNYSVSTAGAGGMIQMIPRTYEAIRQQHSGIDLEPDFVNGMRNHANALKAMLLYMNDTWSKLQESSDVQDAMRNGVATKPELLAAGYNSNPLRLPTYLKNGGAEWRSLIPAETRMYLAIYASVDSNVTFSASAASGVSPGLATTGVAPNRGLVSILFSWMNLGLFGK
jgi:hypothetical protein